jgi:Bacteriophage Sf6, terminase small subunit-like
VAEDARRRRPRSCWKRFCELIANGSPAVAACSRLGIGCTAIGKWQREDPEFAKAYAREDRADLLADEIITLADAAQGLEAAGVQACRLCVDAESGWQRSCCPRSAVTGLNTRERAAGPLPCGPALAGSWTVEANAQRAYSIFR